MASLLQIWDRIAGGYRDVTGADGAIDVAVVGDPTAPAVVQGSDGANAERLATEATLADLLAKFTSGTTDNNVGEDVERTVKSSAGRVLSLSVRHADASALYLWTFDNTAASGTVFKIPILLPPASHTILGTDFFTTEGLPFSAGFTYGFSTSGSSYSAYGTAANCFCTAVYA